MAKQKKDTSAVKHKPVRNGGSGRPNNLTRNVSNKNNQEQLSVLYYSIGIPFFKQDIHKILMDMCSYMILYSV